MDKLMMEAIGSILREERELTDSQLKKIEESLDSGLIPKFAVGEIEARKSAIESYAVNMLHRRSEVVSKNGATVHKHLRLLDE